MNNIYIHYWRNNTNSFKKEKIKPIKNELNFTKPIGGFWASNINAEYGWKQWCDDNEFKFYNKDNAFVFTLSDNAKVLYINDTKILANLPMQQSIIKSWLCLDFEKLSEQYDAIEVNISKCNRLYDLLYGWDCDSILIMNPDVIQEVKTVGK